VTTTDEEWRTAWSAGTADEHKLNRTIEATHFSERKRVIADTASPATSAARVHSHLSAVYQFSRIVLERSIRVISPCSAPVVDSSLC
jgi:hypothetical protein